MVRTRRPSSARLLMIFHEVLVDMLATRASVTSLTHTGWSLASHILMWPRMMSSRWGAA